MKRTVSILAALAAVAGMFVFTGCEPNVPENDNVSDPFATIQNPNRDNERNDAFNRDRDDERNDRDERFNGDKDRNDRTERRNDREDGFYDEDGRDRDGEGLDDVIERNGNRIREGAEDVAEDVGDSLEHAGDRIVGNNVTAVEGDTPTAADFTPFTDLDDNAIIAQLGFGTAKSKQKPNPNSGTSSVTHVNPDNASNSPNTPSIPNAPKHDINSLPNDKIGWGLGSAVDSKNRPLDAIKANKDYGEFGAVFIGESGERPVIYLTFDEGYENGCTGNILEVLKSRNAKATFFVTHDYCKREPALVRQMLDDGHTVANHSYTHPSFPDCSADEVRSEIGRLHDYVKSEFDYEMNLIRFPMGEFSKRSLAVAQEMNYTSVFWSFAYVDWNVNNQPEPAVALEKIKSATHPGAIVLLHAVSKTNAAILGEVIDYWHGLGYTLEVL